MSGAAEKVNRRQALGAIAGAVGGLVVGFAGGWFAKPPEKVEGEAITVTQTRTIERTVTQTETRQVEVAKKIVLGMVLGGFIEGSTWDGRQKIAVDRLKELYPWFDYVYDEGVVLKGRDPVSSAKDLITINNANVIFGSWEPAAVPAFHTLSEQFPEVYFMGIVGSDVSAQRNFIRVFIRQYQAMYLEGLIAGAITQSNKIGIAVGPAVVQNLRRMAAFYLGIKESNPDAKLYIKYVGEWYDPPKEREVSLSLVDQGVDVLTHYTDSVEPLQVAEESEIW
ncbi:MAG TPA: BMP family ABC transporter substrate-binding protein, partial [Aigarchaeota archaeon]|nr:BMP family ABC transporter substrate-binding protein [Aigarchaeota archaeon]